MGAALAIEAKGLFKSFDGKPAVRGIDIAVPEGSIYGILGPNGAGKTTTLADAARHHRAGRGRAAPARPRSPARNGPRRRLSARGARPLSGDEGARGDRLHGRAARPAARCRPQARRDPAAARTASATMSTSRSRACRKGMAQTIQLFGTIVHQPKLIVLDEPFSGLDAINQGRLEHMIRDEAAAGTTVIFSTHVIHHAERLCERIAIIAGGQMRFEGLVSDARDRLRPQVRLKTAATRRAVARRLAGRMRARGRSLVVRPARRRGSSLCSRPCSTARRGSRSCRSSGPACTTPSSRSPAKSAAREMEATGASEDAA